MGEVIDHRSETGGWRPGGPSEASVDRQVWRIEAVRAGRSRTSFAGVFDLSWEPAQDRWLLVRVHD